MVENKIIIGSDHAGVEYKAYLVSYMKELGMKVEDVGPNSNESVDYPDFIHPVASSVHKGSHPRGIVICGSGNGASITANKYQKVRSALCWNIELAELARLHNDANILAIPARFVSKYLALEMLKAFLNTNFEGGRHQRRVDKISCS